MPRILKIVITYVNEDVRNADELGLFYRQPPSLKVARGAFSEIKKEEASSCLLDLL